MPDPTRPVFGLALAASFLGACATAGWRRWSTMENLITSVEEGGL